MTLFNRLKCFKYLSLLIVFNFSYVAYATDNFDNLNILFIGHSLIANNNTPETFRQLCIASGYNVNVSTAMFAGRSILAMSYMDAVRDSIKARQWDYIVLQSSDNTAWEEFYDLECTAINRYRTMANDNCPTTKIIYNLTWGWMNGLSFYEDGILYSYSYEEHFNMIFSGTLRLQRENPPLIISPVGLSWHNLINENPDVKYSLYANDGYHPAIHGSYVSACTMFSTIYYEHNSNIDYYAGISEETAKHYQDISRNTVLDNVSQWNINYDYTAIGEAESEQLSFKLYQNSPNPFSTSTTISFKIENAGFVILDLYNLRGQFIKVLASEYFEPGTHFVKFPKGEFARGTYIYKLKVGEKYLVKKMIVY